MPRAFDPIQSIKNKPKEVPKPSGALPTRRLGNIHDELTNVEKDLNDPRSQETKKRVRSDLHLSERGERGFKNMPIAFEEDEKTDMPEGLQGRQYPKADVARVRGFENLPGPTEEPEKPAASQSISEQEKQEYIKDRDMFEKKKDMIGRVTAEEFSHQVSSERAEEAGRGSSLWYNDFVKELNNKVSDSDHLRSAVASRAVELGMGGEYSFSSNLTKYLRRAKRSDTPPFSVKGMVDAVDHPHKKRELIEELRGRLASWVGATDEGNKWFSSMDENFRKTFFPEYGSEEKPMTETLDKLEIRPGPGSPDTTAWDRLRPARSRRTHTRRDRLKRITNGR